MTAPALTWRPISTDSSENCCYPECAGPPVLMRGPSRPGINLDWKAYCRSHAAMYGAIVRRGHVVLRLGA